MFDGRKILRNVFIVLVLISFFVTGVVGYFYIAHNREIDRLLRVGLIIETQYLRDVSINQLLEGAVAGMVDSLEDPYSVYMDQEDYKDLQRHIQGSIGGIGVYVSIKDDKLVVYSPIEGTPAFKAGIKKNDVIVKINDIFTSDIEYDEAVKMMRGEPGTEVKIGVLRGAEPKILEFTIVRDIIDIQLVRGTVLPEDERIGYLRIMSFSSDSDEEVDKEIKSLLDKDIKALILDLRENPGGDLEAAVNIAKHFVPKGPIVHIVDKNDNKETYENTGDFRIKIPLVVLVNGGSASASEVLSGAIKDTKTGILIGEKTFGKGVVQGVYPLKFGEGLKLTTSKYLTPNFIDIHEKGIEPNIVVEFSEEDKDDKQLNKAIQVLQDKLKS